MIRFLINVYIFIIIADAILSYLPQYRNYEGVKYIRKLANYSLDPVRKFLPEDFPVDVSPIIIILGLNVIKLLW